MERFAVKSQQEDIQIEVEYPDGEDLPLIWADRDGVIQVLDNLLSNAMKYSNKGTRITLRACRRGEWLAIEVIDEGIGIPRRDLERIFERFYRVDKARSRSMGGTGLGLSIARQIVLAHGGTIEIESEWQKGTKVRFTLPVCEEVEVDD
ncbi:sensor histidine kinase [Aneurinibacillus terranovensis]|uniref:sensor histidine kinase n=1 Tax=Aneurinibacillus terranovensis TaxID=278991 RepID=UPI003CCBBD8F